MSAVQARPRRRWVGWSTDLDLEVGMRETSRGPIEVATAGSGPAVLLIHGIPGSWRQIVPLAEDLARSFRVVLVSRPGYGASPLSTGRTYEEQADVMAEVLDAESSGRPSAVVGVSGGGPAAIALAARHDQQVGALVMACAMAPHLVKLPPYTQIMRKRGIAETVMPLARRVARRRIATAVAGDIRRMRAGLLPREQLAFDADERLRSDVLRHAQSHAEAPAAIAGMRNDLVQIDRAHAEPTAHELVTAPSLLMYGELDDVTPVDHGRLYSSVMPQAELVIFDGAGHLFLLTRRVEASATIHSFIERSLA